MGKPTQEFSSPFDVVYFIHSHATDVKTFENQQSARYGHSTVAYEPVWSVAGVV